MAPGRNIQGTFKDLLILNQGTFGNTSGQFNYAIPHSNYLAYLQLYIENTNGATSNTGHTIESDISQIRLVIDGDTVWSGEPRMLRKMMHYDVGKYPDANETQVGAAVQWCTIKIPFGRNDFDRDFLLPAHKFKDIQVQIDYAWTDNATTGFASSSSNAKITITAKMLEPTSAPVQTYFLARKQTQNTTFASTLNGTQQDINLPVGAGNGLVRRFMAHVYEAAKQDGVAITNYEVVLNDSVYLVKSTWRASQTEDQNRYNASVLKAVTVVKADGETYASRVGRLLAPISVPSVGDRSLGATVAGDTLTFAYAVANTGVADATADPQYLFLESTGVPYSTMIDFGTEDIGNSINVTAPTVTSFKFRPTIGTITSSAEFDLVVEQVMLL